LLCQCLRSPAVYAYGSRVGVYIFRELFWQRRCMRQLAAFPVRWLVLLHAGKVALTARP